MRLMDITDGVARTIEGVTDTVSGALLEPTIRLGVTGLARSGKTVFITSLVANLMDRGRFGGLAAASDGRIRAAFLQPQPDDTLPRFDYETHLAALTGPNPVWPESTRSVSELRLSFRLQPGGLMGVVSGPRRFHLDIVDYPGEWILDLALMDQDYAGWSKTVLDRMQTREPARGYLAALKDLDPAKSFDEARAKDLALAFTGYLEQARDAGFYDLTPGRFLLPGDLSGAPVLTFAPLPPGAAPRGSMAREMERRFEAYKTQVVTPFFREHITRIDRQIVLVDALGALARGPAATGDLAEAMGGILRAFRPGRNAFLSRIFMGRRVEKILFAATKADTLHHRQHDQLVSIMEAVLREARDRADFAGADTRAMALASLRATTEDTRTNSGAELDMVRGRVAGREKPVAAFPGALPGTGAEVLSDIQSGADTWNGGPVQALDFLPAPLQLDAGEGPPHIRLDRAAEYLIGDRL